MAKLNFLIVAFCALLTVGLARRIQRDIVEKVFGPKCGPRSFEITKLDMCPDMLPQGQTLTEQINLILLNKEYTVFAADWKSRLEEQDDPFGSLALVQEMCIYVNNPDNIKYVNPAETLSYDQMCELANITDAKLDGLTENEQVAITRKVCRIYSSAESIASVSRPESDTELTPEQYAVLKSKWEANNCSYTLACDGADYASVCGYLNETVSHEDQAKKLGITVELYEKLVAVKKLYTDKTDKGRLALAKRKCEAIDGIESNRINLLAPINVLRLLRKTMVEFNRIWNDYYQAADSEKMSKLGIVCSLMHEKF